MHSSSPEISLKLALDRLFSSFMHVLDRVTVIFGFVEDFLVFSMKRFPLKVDILLTLNWRPLFYQGPTELEKNYRRVLLRTRKDEGKTGGRTKATPEGEAVVLLNCVL